MDRKGDQDLIGELLMDAEGCPAAHCHCGWSCQGVTEESRSPGGFSCRGQVPAPPLPAEGMGWEGPHGVWDVFRIRGITRGLQGAAGEQGGSVGYRSEGGAVFLPCLSTGGKKLIRAGKALSAAPSQWHSQV